MEKHKTEKTLKFLENAKYNGEIVHHKGETKTLDNKLGMADRWIKRGVAVEVVKGEKAPQTPAQNTPAQDPKNPAATLANDKTGSDNSSENDL